MFERRALPQMTIRAQIIVVILLALITVITTGRILERWAKENVTSIEKMNEWASAVAAVIAHAPTEERAVVLANVRRAGWDLTLLPLADTWRLEHDYGIRETIGTAFGWIFPLDKPSSLGGRRTFLDGHRVIAVKVDDTSMLVLSGVPDTIVADFLIGEMPYYFVALVVLVIFFFLFAMFTVTEPIRRIAHAAAADDINDPSQVFDETGTVELAALARALNGMRSRVRLMLDTRTRMLRGIGHDLRTPLTRMRLRADRMEDGPVKDALLLDIDRIGRLLTETLNYLRDDYITEKVERVDMASLLVTVCDDFCDIGHAVEYHGPKRLIAQCRPLSIIRAVTNLCDNAVKFAQNIHIELRQEGKSIVIAVTDDGPGIDEHVREKVCEPFFKGDDARSDNDAGFGLGLSIVTDIAHAHRGHVELLPRMPNGLVARLTIPVVV